MPTYDYQCSKCGHRFEEIQKMSDPALSQCPKCRGKVKRLINGGLGIIFKGSGFYVTDSRSASAKKPAKKDGAAATDTPKTETTKSAETSGKQE
jgi:putative FmdB family regulatory protein